MDDYIAEIPEQHLCDTVRLEQERCWLRENREAIASINAFLDRHGLLANRLRPRSHERLKP
jgi:post-segregation antitoxin (ccd killing protein)